MTLYRRIAPGELELLSEADETAARENPDSLFSNDSGYEILMPQAEATALRAEWAVSALKSLRSGKRLLLDSQYALQQGAARAITIGGAAYLFSPSSLQQQKITSLALKATAVIMNAGGLTWEDGFTFPASDGSEISMTAQQFLTFADDLERLYVRPMDMNYGAKARAIAVADAAALAEIDPTTGWPS